MKIDADTLKAIERTRKETPHTQRTAYIVAEAARLGVSKDTLYRHLRKLRKGAVKRSPQPKQYDRGLVEDIMRRKVEGMTFGTAEREIPSHVLRRELLDEGVPEDEVPSVSTINRILDEELMMREGRTYTRIEASVANEQAQLDHSRSKHFQLKSHDPDRGDWLLVVRAEELAYKVDNLKLRTWYTSYVDRFSRLWIARVVPASGESVTVGLEHLDYVWNRPPDAHPVSYLPWALQTDRGALARSQPYQRALDALGIEPVRAQSKEAQGMVENRFRQMWAGFELPLARKLGAGATIWLSDLNALLMEHAVREGRERPHPVLTHLSREDAYLQSIRAYPPREVDASVLRVACRVETRKVDQYGTVSLHGRRYAVPQYVAHDGRRVATLGQRVRVWAAESGEVVGELVEQYSKPFRLEPWQPNALGDYSRRTQTTTRERVEADLARERAEAKDARRRERAAKQARQSGGATVAPLLPETTLVDADSPVVRSGARETAAPEQARLMTEHEARVYINRRLEAEGRFLADYTAVFGPLLNQPGAIQRDDVDRLLSAVLDRVRKAS